MMKQNIFRKILAGVIVIGCAAAVGAGIAALGAQKDEVILTDDFEEYREGASFFDCISSSDWSATLAEDEKRGARITADGTGNKALEFWAKKTSTEPYAVKKLSALENDVKLMLRFKVQVNDSQAYVSLGTKSNELCRFNKASVNLYDETGAAKNVNLNFDTGALESFMLIVDCSDWSVKMYYQDTFIDQGFVKAKPVDLSKAEARFTAKFQGGQAEGSVLFDDVKIVNCSGEGYQFTVEEAENAPVNHLYLQFSMPVDEATVIPSAVIAEGTEAIAAAGIENTQQGWRVDFEENLSYDSDYTIRIEGITDILGRSAQENVSIKTRPQSFLVNPADLYIDYVSEESKISALLPGNLIAAVKAQNELEVPSDVTVCAVLYRQDGSMEAVEKTAVQIQPQETAVITCPITIEDTAGKKLAVYVWDNFTEQNSYGVTRIFE